MEELQGRVEEERTRVLGLEARLSRRRAAEAAELELLRSQQEDVDRRSATTTRALEQAKEQQATLTVRQRALEQGLSRAQRSWLRVGEPVLAGLLLFLALTAVGASWRHPGRAAALEVLGFFIGLLVALARRSRRGARP